MNRAALVTGGSSGIGLATGQMLARNGFALTILGRTAGKLKQAVKELEEGGTDVVGEVVDVADAGSIATAVKGHADRHGRLDVLVNSAGVLGAGALEDYSVEQVDEVLDVDLRATVLSCLAALGLLRTAGAEHGRALIANIASISGKRGDAGFSVYCAAKFGVVGFTQSIRQELAGDGIGACAICPGLVDTHMGDWARGWARPEVMLQPGDVASAIEALLDKAADDVPPELVLENRRQV